MSAKREEIIEGVAIDRRGVVDVDSKLEQPLCDLAIELQSGGRAVDVEHVLAAIVMAVRDGKAPRGSTLNELAEHHGATLARYVEVLFAQHGGQVSDE